MHDLVSLRRRNGVERNSAVEENKRPIAQPLCIQFRSVTIEVGPIVLCQLCTLQGALALQRRDIVRYRVKLSGKFVGIRNGLMSSDGMRQR